MITHAVIFAPIGQVSRSDQIVQRLSNAIITGLLEPKEQLPNETDLAKMMGVSHITIREALNTLRANNLIHTVRGRNGGSFVCENIDGKIAPCIRSRRSVRIICLIWVKCIAPLLAIARGWLPDG